MLLCTQRLLLVLEFGRTSTFRLRRFPEKEVSTASIRNTENEDFIGQLQLFIDNRHYPYFFCGRMLRSYQCKKTSLNISDYSQEKAFLENGD